MTPSEFQALAARTRNPKLDFQQHLSNGALGLCGEAGEVTELIKKCLYHGHPMDTTKVTKELGDVSWYLVDLCTTLNISFETIMKLCIEKLKIRYPETFSEEASLQRKDVKNGL